MLWIKTFHIVFMVTWFAGLFYLPRLFVYHAQAREETVLATFKVMERRLLIMTHIGGALTWLFGLLLLFGTPVLVSQGWMQLKLALVVLLSLYHAWCYRIVQDFARDRIAHGHVWYRWFNEIPTVVLITVVALVVVKPH